MATSRGSRLLRVASLQIPRKGPVPAQGSPPVFSGWSDQATRQNSEEAQPLHPLMPNPSVGSAKLLGSQVNPWILSPPISQGACCFDYIPCPQSTALLCFRGSAQPLSQLLTEPTPHLHLTIRPAMGPGSQVRICNGPQLFLVILF